MAEEDKGILGSMKDTIKSVGEIAFSSLEKIERVMFPEFDLDEEEETKLKMREETNEENSEVDWTPTWSKKHQRESGENIEEEGKRAKIILPEYKQGDPAPPDENAISSQMKRIVERVKEGMSGTVEDEKKNAFTVSAREIKDKSSKKTIEKMLAEARNKPEPALEPKLTEPRTIYEPATAIEPKPTEPRTIYEPAIEPKPTEPRTIYEPSSENQFVERSHEIIERAQHDKAFKEAVLLSENPLKLDPHKDISKMPANATLHPDLTGKMSDVVRPR